MKTDTNNTAGSDCSGATCSPLSDFEKGPHSYDLYSNGLEPVALLHDRNHSQGEWVTIEEYRRMESERNHNRRLYETECKDHESIRKTLDRVIRERDELKALVGTIRSMLPIPVRNVDDITPPQHSHEIGDAIELLLENV